MIIMRPFPGFFLAANPGSTTLPDDCSHNVHYRYQGLTSVRRAKSVPKRFFQRRWRPLCVQRTRFSINPLNDLVMRFFAFAQAISNQNTTAGYLLGVMFHFCGTQEQKMGREKNVTSVELDWKVTPSWLNSTVEAMKNEL